MLKKLAFSGAVFAAFAGVALAAPAQANTWPPEELDVNVSRVTDNIAVCGNRGVGDVTTIAAPLTPIIFADREQVNCSVTVDQD